MNVRYVMLFVCVSFATSECAEAQVSGVQETLLAPSTLTEGDNFGRNIDLEGDVLVVGADLTDSASSVINSGTVYIFERTAGVWNPVPSFSLAPSSLIQDENFGASVAISNQRIAIGAPGFTAPGEVNAGAVYVYLFDAGGNTWNLEHGPIFVNLETTTLDQFGWSLDLEDDRMVVGARFDEPGPQTQDCGRAFVFERAGATWSNTAILFASDAERFDNFGTSVALSGSRIVVGAPGEDGLMAMTPDAGAAYVFEKQSTGWVQEAKLLRTTPSPQDCFGSSVAIDTLMGAAETIVVGAPFAESADILSGVANVFTRSGSAWPFQAELLPAVRNDNDKFGSGISLQGDRLVIGSWNAPVAEALSGNATIFERDTATWTEQSTLTAGTPGFLDHFGASVALDGPTVAVGAWQRDTSGDSNAGATYVFDLVDVTPSDRCNGDGGNQMGCTDCPCLNEATPGTIGGCLNSVMTSARLYASGSHSVSLPFGSDDDLKFELDGGVPTSLATLISGDMLAPGGMATPCFGLGTGVQSAMFDGLRCAIMMTRRHGSRGTDASGEIGMPTDPWGGDGNPQVGIAQAAGGFVAGQTRYFQVQYREDPLLSCGRGQNSTQAIEITFTL